MSGQTDTPQRESGPHRWLSALPVAAMFLTRLPVRAPNTGLAGAAVAFPVVGLLVGALGGGAYGLAWLAGLPALACAFLGVCATVAVTGALHEDGLADMADGLAGGTPEDAIRLMRDSRIGGYGVLALIFSVGLRAAALAALAGPLAVIVAMASAGALSRAAMPAVMRTLPPASGTGLAAAAGRPDGLDVFLAVGIAVFLALSVLGALPALAMAGAAFIAAGAVAALARRRLGGYTGDVLGAVQQAAEIAGLLAIAAVT
ncbi:MAG: adenosylcobinamide-GDP ribazoletransferase [Alphaproteobacteria bacterium]|nr:adenosylcobinamide-GDP ribazoletransferase [Alphaproteobacteria bacterium]